MSDTYKAAFAAALAFVALVWMHTTEAARWGVVEDTAPYEDVTEQSFAEKADQTALDAHTGAAAPHSGHLVDVTAGLNVTVDRTNPQNPVISASGSGGTADHSLLINRDAADQHPIGAVTGLQTALDGKEPVISPKNTGFNLNVGTSAGTVAAGDDSRFTDARPPTGSASGVLSGTYPSPGFAQDMATQAELDAHTGAAAPHPGHLISVVAGSNVTVDNTDPQNPVVSSTGSGGVADHGALTGLGDDDHTQYHTDARGDARYYTQAQIDAAGYLTAESDPLFVAEDTIGELNTRLGTSVEADATGDQTGAEIEGLLDTEIGHTDWRKATGTTAGTHAAGDDSRFGDASSLHGTSVADCTTEGEIHVLRSGAYACEAKPAAGSNPVCADVTDSTAAGCAVVTAADAAAQRTALGLGTAATTAATDYATAAQGVLADNATQPGDLAAVATTGAYSDLSGTPTIPDELTDLDTFVTGSELDTDHAKLALIEPLATADQEAHEVLVTVSTSPANYTPDNVTVDGHLAGIDDALASAGTAPAYFSLTADGSTVQSVSPGTSVITTSLTNEVADTKNWVSGAIFFPQEAGCWMLGGTMVVDVDAANVKIIVFILHSTDGSTWSTTSEKAVVAWRAESTQANPFGGSGAQLVCVNGTTDRFSLGLLHTNASAVDAPISGNAAYAKFWGQRVD